MILSISTQEYKKFTDERERLLFQQSPDFFKVYEDLHQNFEILGFIPDKYLSLSESNNLNHLHAVVRVRYLRYKKFFLLADLVYGPIFDEKFIYNTNIWIEFLNDLEKFLKKRKKNLLKIRISPLIFQNEYRFIKDKNQENTNNPYHIQKLYNVESIIESFRKSSYTALQDSYGQNYSLPGKFFYIKDLNFDSYNELISSCHRQVKNNINKAELFDIKIKFLDENQLTLYDKIKKDTYKRLNKDIKISFNYHREGLKYYPKVYYPLAYIDCNSTIKKLENKIVELNTDLSKISKENLNLKRIANRKKEAEKELAARLEKLKIVKELKNTHGNIVNMAAAAFYQSKSDMVYLDSCVFSEFMHFCPIYAIFSYMAKIALAEKCKYYNFFWQSSPYEDEADDFSVLNFKKQFNGYISETIGSFEKKIRFKFLP